MWGIVGVVFGRYCYGEWGRVGGKGSLLVTGVLLGAAGGKASKIIVPLEIQGLAGLAAGIYEAAKDAGDT